MSCSYISVCQSNFYPASIAHLTSAQYAPELADVFIAAENPAMLPELKHFSAGVYCEKRFLSAELVVLNISAAYNFSKSGAAIHARHFGSNIYNEKSAGVGYGRTLGKLSIGIQFNYQSVRISASNFSAIGLGFASVWKIAENLFAFCMISNPPFTKAENTLTLPTAVKTGMGYMISENLYVGIESQKEAGRQPILIASFRYWFTEEKYVRSSWTTIINQPFINLGWKVKAARFEAGFHYHPSLGVSPNFIFIYQPSILTGS